MSRPRTCNCEECKTCAQRRYAAAWRSRNRLAYNAYHREYYRRQQEDNRDLGLVADFK